jgi:drug/metabolite transporter (DMT)-like permease
MSSQQLIRWGAAAAVLAGVLRTATSFWTSAGSGAAVEVMYLVIDLLLLFGILAIYACHSDRLGRSGFIGFVLAVIGAAVIAGPDGTIGAVNTYVAGSLSLGTGLVFLAVASWMAHTLPRWIPAMWVASTVLGIIAVAAGLEHVFVITGVALGLALIGAGARVWSAVSRSLPR